MSYYFRDIWLSKNKHTMKTILRLGPVGKWNWEVAELSDECAERTQQKVVQFLGLETRWLRSSLSSLMNFTTHSVLVPNACLAALIHLVCLSPWQTGPKGQSRTHTSDSVRQRQQWGLLKNLVKAPDCFDQQPLPKQKRTTHYNFPPTNKEMSFPSPEHLPPSNWRPG